MGVTFQPKAVKNGEIVDSYDRDRRENVQPRLESCLTKCVVSWLRVRKSQTKAINVP